MLYQLIDMMIKQNFLNNIYIGAHFDTMRTNRLITNCSKYIFSFWYIDCTTGWN